MTAASFGGVQALNDDVPDPVVVHVHRILLAKATAAHVVGGRLFPGEHHPASFQVVDDGSDIDFSMLSRDGDVAVTLRGKAASALPPSSRFRSLREASDFFEQGSLGYSDTAHRHRLDGLRLTTKDWRVTALDVEHVRSSLFDDPALFPPGSVEFDCALVMRDIEHEWQAADDLQLPDDVRAPLCPSGRKGCIRDNPLRSSLDRVNRVIPSRPAPRRQRRSGEALVLMLVLLSACYRYRPEVLSSLQTGQVSAGTRVRLTYRESRHKPVEMDLERLDLPYVSGIVYTRGNAPGDRIPHHVRIDLRDIQTIEAQELDGTMSAVAVISGLAGLAALFVVAVTSTLQLSGNRSESP